MKYKIPLQERKDGAVHKAKIAVVYEPLVKNGCTYDASIAKPDYSLFCIEIEEKSEGLAYKKLCQVYKPDDSRKISGKGFLSLCEIGAAARVYKTCPKHKQKYHFWQNETDIGCEQCQIDGMMTEHEQYEEERESQYPSGIEYASELESNKNYVRMLENALGALVLKHGEPIDKKEIIHGVSLDILEKDALNYSERFWHEPMFVFNQTAKGLKVTLVDEMCVIGIAGCGEVEMDNLYKTRLTEFPTFSSEAIEHFIHETFNQTKTVPSLQETIDYLKNQNVPFDEKVVRSRWLKQVKSKVDWFEEYAFKKDGSVRKHPPFTIKDWSSEETKSTYIQIKKLAEQSETKESI